MRWQYLLPVLEEVIFLYFIHLIIFGFSFDWTMEFYFWIKIISLTMDIRRTVAFVMVHLHSVVFFDYCYCDDSNGRVFQLVIAVTSVFGHLKHNLFSIY